MPLTIAASVSVAPVFSAEQSKSQKAFCWGPVMGLSDTLPSEGCSGLRSHCCSKSPLQAPVGVQVPQSQALFSHSRGGAPWTVAHMTGLLPDPPSGGSCP